MNPAGEEGEQVYNSTYKTMQFCDGTDWYTMKGGGGLSIETTDCVDGSNVVFNSGTGGLKCGDAGGDGFDGDPDAFSFTDQTGVSLSTLTTSNEITITGIDPLAVVSVSGDGNPEISVNGGAWTNASSVILEGYTLQVRLTSSSSDGTALVATITVGGVTDDWSVTTFSTDTTPDAYSFTDLTGQNPGTLITSNTINISGINTPTPVSISGPDSPQFRIAGGSWVTSGNISNGQSLQLRLTSHASPSTTRVATVTVGGVADNWSVTTKSLAYEYWDYAGVNCDDWGAMPWCGGESGGQSCSNYGWGCVSGVTGDCEGGGYVAWGWVCQ